MIADSVTVLHRSYHLKFEHVKKLNHINSTSFIWLIHLLLPAYKPYLIDVKKECTANTNNAKISSERTYTGTADQYYMDGQQKCNELCTSNPNCKYYVYGHDNRCSLWTGCDELSDSTKASNIYEKLGKAYSFI